MLETKIEMCTIFFLGYGALFPIDFVLTRYSEECNSLKIHNSRSIYPRGFKPGIFQENTICNGLSNYGPHPLLIMIFL